MSFAGRLGPAIPSPSRSARSIARQGSLAGQESGPMSGPTRQQLPVGVARDLWTRPPRLSRSSQKLSDGPPARGLRDGRSSDEPPSTPSRKKARDRHEDRTCGSRPKERHCALIPAVIGTEKRHYCCQSPGALPARARNTTNHVTPRIMRPQARLQTQRVNRVDKPLTGFIAKTR